jgi:hypothetical protein
MRKLISFEWATQLGLLLFGLFILFHLSVVIGIVFFDFVPVDFLWGGRLQSKGQLLGFEVISLIVMALCCFVVLIRSERIHLPRMVGVASIILWILFFLFLLNTIGNIMARTTFEKFFSIVTVCLAFLCLRLALGENQDSNQPH